MPWSGMDQRRFPRISYRCVVSLRQARARHTAESHTENIGNGGMCVLLGKGFDIFSPVDVELELADEQPALTCRGMISWVVRRRDPSHTDQFDTGIEFTDLSDEDKTRLQEAVSRAGGTTSRS